MRLSALLVLTFAVLRARAASIPDHIVPELEKKLSEAVKEVLDKDALALKNDLDDPELLDQVNAVVAESEPSLKTEDVPASASESTDIKRAEVDLNNPGAPQVQRHDYQTPEVFDDAKLKESSVSQSAAETQSVLHEGLLDIAQKAQQPTFDNEKILLVRKSIDELQENFSKQLRQLNDVLQKYSKMEGAGSLRTVGVVEQDSALTSDVKKVQTEFDSGIQSLSEDVGSLKADGDTTVSPPGPPLNFLQGFTQFVNNFGVAIQNSINNLSTAYQSAVNNTQANAPGFLQGPLNAISNVIRPQQQQAQQSSPPQQSQQPGFFANIFNSITAPVQNWLSPTTSAPQTQAPTSSSPVIAPITNLPTQEPAKPAASLPSQETVSEDAVEATKDADSAAEKGHGGGQGSEHSDNSDGIVAEVANPENKNTEQPEVVLVTETENSDFKEKVTENDNLELTTSVVELQKLDESITEIVPLVLVRSKEEIVESEEIKTEEPKTELPSMKDELTTVLIDLMMNDEPKFEAMNNEAKVEVMNEDPKIEDRISSDPSIKEDNKVETTVLPNSADEIPTTEVIKDMFMTDGLLSLMNSPVKEITEAEVSGTEVSEIDAVTEKEELMTNLEVKKVEEPMTTLNPLVQVEDRNQEPPVTEVEIKKVEEEERTTVIPNLEEQALNMEVLPTEEVKRDEPVNDPTTVAPNVEEKKEIKRRVVRRLIKRTLL